jgi:hypothetical protein
MTSQIEVRETLAINRATELLVLYARSNHRFNSKSGHLDITTIGIPAIRTDVGIEGAVTAGAPYAGFVHFGTGIYHTPDAHSAWDVYGLQVFNTNAKTQNGGTVFTRHTHHLGQHPDPWIKNAFDANRELVLDMMKWALEG